MFYPHVPPIFPPISTPQNSQKTFSLAIFHGKSNDVICRLHETSMRSLQSFPNLKKNISFSSTVVISFDCKDVSNTRDGVSSGFFFFSAHTHFLALNSQNNVKNMILCFEFKLHKPPMLFWLQNCYFLRGLDVNLTNPRQSVFFCYW